MCTRACVCDRECVREYARLSREMRLTWLGLPAAPSGAKGLVSPRPRLLLRDGLQDSARFETSQMEEPKPREVRMP